MTKVPRGGRQQQQQQHTEDSSDHTKSIEGGNDVMTTTTTKTTTIIRSNSSNSNPVTASASFMSVTFVFATITRVFATIGKTYSQSLIAYPIWTKSCTAGVIFGLSDYLAQTIEASGFDNNNDTQDQQQKSLDWTRLVATTLVGLLYFGPAAHYWYEWIFRLLPETGLISTLYKAFWGQVLFGPSFTCIFFATSLCQSGNFTITAWWNKIRKDLPGAWLAGVGFWPFVDLISYSVIPVPLIPLFVNMASLVWTVYLSLVANKRKG
jgi:protein Mpv17